MAREMYKRRRYCRFSAEGIKEVDYKDVDLLKDFVSENAKIIPARMTGTKAKYQRQLTSAVKRAHFPGFNALHRQAPWLISRD